MKERDASLRNIQKAQEQQVKSYYVRVDSSLLRADASQKTKTSTFFIVESCVRTKFTRASFFFFFKHNLNLNLFISSLLRLFPNQILFALFITYFCMN